MVLEEEEDEELDEEGFGAPVAALRKKRLMEVWEDILGGNCATFCVRWCDQLAGISVEPIQQRFGKEAGG